MINGDMMNDFGIELPTESPAQTEQPNAADDSINLLDTSDAALEARIAQLEAWGKEQSAQPADPAQQSNTAAQQTPAAIAQPTGQQQAAVIDPIKAFEDASQRAFVTDGGELDTAKINDFFLTNGKSILKYANGPIVPVGASPDLSSKVATLDPEKEYSEKINEVVGNFDVILEDQKKRGFTADQAVANIKQYLSDLSRDRDARLEMKKTIAEEAKRFAPDFEEARSARISAAIDRNTAELSSGLNGLIPGLDGRQVLNQFILNKKYGGEQINYLFTKAHPEVAKLPEAEQVKIGNKWFEEFQTDKVAMAHVAEFGRLRWMAENMKPILEHAQKIGAQKVQMGREAQGFAPSGLNAVSRASSGPSAVEQFFNNGIDSVN